jgi:hypothetical protein
MEDDERFYSRESDNRLDLNILCSGDKPFAFCGVTLKILN